MYRIHQMEVPGAQGESGVCISWIPNGLLVEKVHKKLDALRSHYESQLSSLQDQLEHARRNSLDFNMEEAQNSYRQLLSTFRDQLDGDHKDLLDQLVSKMEDNYEHTVSLEVMAVKTTLEQVYHSKSQLELSTLEAKHEDFVKELKAGMEKDFKERMNAGVASGGKDSNKGHVDSSLTDKYNQLIQKINQALDEKVMAHVEGHPNKSWLDDDESNNLALSQEIRNLLMNQQEEISSLRSQLLGDYESVLQSRTQSVMEQTQEMAQLEEQLRALQEQYANQVSSFQEMLTVRDDEQKKSSEEERNKYESQQADLKNHYEKRVQDMEASFEREINCIKEKYEEQIAGLVHARLGLEPESLSSVDEKEDSNLPGDTDSDNAETPLSSITDTAMRIKDLEQELKERDSQIQELKMCLDCNDDGFKKKVEELEGELQEAKAACNHLEELVEENRQVIETLEHEKKESEKLYKDLLEKESPRSKSSATTRGYISSESVDDSFSSAREEIQDTPRSLDSGDNNNGPESHQKSASGESNLMFSGEEGRDDDHDTTIPFANDSVESDLTPVNNSNDNNNNNNNNNNNDNDNDNEYGVFIESGDNNMEDELNSLKDQVESLTRQLEELKASETKLLCRIEENQHGHIEMMENLRHELEHEKQVEVETLQSEFKVQMEVELRRQAAEMMQTQQQSTTTMPAATASSSSHQQPTTNSEVEIDDKLFSTLETADDDILEQSSNNMFLQTAKFELQTVVMATPNSKDDGDDVVDENLSDDSKVVTSALSPVCSPTVSSPPVMAAGGQSQSLPLTDMEKEVQAMREEYESKISHLMAEIEKMGEDSKSMKDQVNELKSQLDETEARYDRLMEGVHSGDHPELNELMKDKYDQELELAKSLMQKDFDETLREEKKKLMDHHRKLMGNFMEDKTQEDEKTERKHEDQMKELREHLQSDFESRIHGYEQEIERLNRDLDLLRETSPRGSDGLLGVSQDSTLPEIEEITLTSQHSGLTSASPGSETSQSSTNPSSPPGGIKSPTGLSYEESEEEEMEAQKVSTLQVRDFSDAVQAPSPSPCLMKEKEQLELKVQQLTAQVERLTQQLIERQDSNPVSPLHSPHNTTLKADDPALISMLQSDLDRMDSERESVQNTNDRLLGLLSDTVKTYVTVEDNISRKLRQVVTGGTPRQGGDSGDGGSSSRAGSVEPGARHGPSGDSQSSRQGSPADFLKGASPDVDTSHDSHCLDNTSILSNATDEGLEISLRLAESIFVGPDLDAEGEEILSDARGRLTTAVDRLLELMEQSMSQLHEAKGTQEDLLATLATRARDVEASQSRGSELNSQLAAEIEAKEYLGLELHKAEGLIAGFVADREANSKQVQTLEEQREALIVELDLTRSRLEEFQRSQSEMDALREELSHQQMLLRENVGQETQEENRELTLESPQASPALLNEVSNLNQERRELASQLQHQLDLSRKRLSEMEALAEEAERRHEAVVEEKNQALEDLGLQLDNTERQLKSSKAFVDELLVEREMEREEHQKEVDKMKAIIEGKDRSASSQERMQREIADLTEQLQSRIANQSALHQRIVDLQKVLEDKELGTNDLKVWVSQLEGELDQKFSEEDQLKERISKLERQLTEISDNNDDELEDTVKAFTPRSEAAESGDSISIPSPVNTGHRNSVVSLEEELLRSKETKDELDQENASLKEQLHEQLLQISGLKNQVDQLRHYASADDSDVVQLRERLAQERDTVEKKEALIAEAERKIEHLESVIQTKQLEAEEMSGRVSRILEMGDTQEENQRLRNDLEELKSQMSETSAHSPSSPSHHQVSLSMPAGLLEEKNEEISELRSRLQQVEADIGQRAEQVSMHQGEILHLQQRLKDRDEEIVDLQDSLASARRGEACLDMSLPMSDEVQSMLNISMTGRTSIQQEFEDTIAQREGEVQSLELQVATLKKDLEEAAARLAGTEEAEEKWRTELSEKDEEIEKLQHDLMAVARENDEMKTELDGMKTEKDNQTDQQKILESLEESVQDKDNEIYGLTLEVQELKGQLEEAAQATQIMEDTIREKEADLVKAQEERDDKRDQLQEKEHKLDQMVIQIDGLQTEISGLTTFQTELQKDYDTIQTMLDDKEKVLEALTQELSDTKTHQDALDSMIQLEAMVASLKKELKEKQNVVDEKEEELYELRDKLEEMENDKGDLDSVEDKFKQAMADLEAERKVTTELQDSLAVEQKNVESLREEMDQISEECTSLKDKLKSMEETLEEKDTTISSQDERLKMAANKEDITTEKVVLLESMLKEDNDNAKEEMRVVIEEYEKIRSEYITKIKDLEEQLQVQDANYLAMRLASGKDLSKSVEIESSKEDALEDLKKQLHELESQKNEDIESLKAQLSEKDKELDGLAAVRQQLEEMDEQLRSRQATMLSLQAENERLVGELSAPDSCIGMKGQEISQITEVSQVMEERDQQLNELEGQLRFRQAALLELEAERDNLMDEKVEMEQKLTKQLKEKENELQEIRAKYANLKDGINEEVLHLEQEMKRSSEARVIKTAGTLKDDEEAEENDVVEELRYKLEETSQELRLRSSKVGDIETELDRKNHELEVRQNTIDALMEQIESMQMDWSMLEAKEQKLELLQGIMRDAGVRVEREEEEDEEVKVRKMLLENVEVKSSGSKEREEEDVCLEMDMVCAESMSGLNTAIPNARSTGQEELEKEQQEAASVQQTVSHQEQKAVMECLQEKIQDKEKDIHKLTGEIEDLKTQIEEQDQVILTLKDELDISKATHQEQLLSRDNQITELREAVGSLKPSASLGKVQQASEGSALSPKTKEQISQLKSELRKAHKALEEMQGSKQSSDQYQEKEEDQDFVDSRGLFSHQRELEALRKIAQEQEEELAMLKADKDDREAGVVEETIQAEKITSVESRGPRASRGSSIDNYSFGSNQSLTDGVPPRIQELLDRLHNLGEDLLSASDFEYLQQHLFQRQSSQDGLTSDTSAWSRERAALMETIVAVKDLLQQADRLAAKSLEELSESGDWRSELLDALIQVYQSETQVLKAEVGTAGNVRPEMDIVLQLESRIHDLERVHQNGLDEMLKADRQSLLDEVDNLHRRLLEARQQLEETRKELDSRIADLDKAKTNAEWKLDRQIQMLEYKIQQEGVIQEDLKKSLNLERQRVSELNSQSSHERSKTFDLQSELSSTQIQLSKVRDALEREQHRFNSVTDALEEEQAKTVHLSEMLETTKRKMTALKERQALDDTQAVLEELRIELDKERQKSYEYSAAEEQAQKQLVSLSEKLDMVKKKLSATKEEYEAKIENLHREWMDREVQDRKDRETESVHKLTDLLEVERASHRTLVEGERQANRKLRDALEEVKAENERFLQLYEMEKSRGDRLEKDADNSNGMLRHLRSTENEAGELQEKVVELEQELSHVQERASALEAELSRGQGHSNGHAISLGQSGEYHREAIGHLMTASYIDEELKVRLAQCCSRLQMIASKLQDMTGHASTQGQGQANGDAGLGDSRGLKVVMEELEKLKANIRDREEKRQNSMDMSSDQLLQHNKQLAEHVKKLKQEKDQMAGMIKKIEADKKQKLSLPEYTSDMTSDEEGVYDRSVWAGEKLSLQMALDSAEHEIQHLRSELRKFSSVTKADGQLMKLDPDKTQRLYGKYLRAESFRKALIYQKKYLLLLLGGYRDTEQETLAILASMGGFPSPRSRLTNGQAIRSSPLAAFRRAGRTVIAIFRMKYLVRKWKRATRVGSPVMIGQITSQHAYVPNSTSSYNLPNNRQQQQQQQYHHHLHHLNNQRHQPHSSPRSSSPSTTTINLKNHHHHPPHQHNPRLADTNGSGSSDYVESLTNGGVSSLAYSTSNARTSSTNPSHHPSSSSHHQLPSSSHHNTHTTTNTSTSTNYNTTPPTKDSSKYSHKAAARGNRDTARRQIFQDSITSDSDSPVASSQGGHRAARVGQPHSSDNDENFMRYLETVQQQLSEGSKPSRRVTWR